MGKTPELPTIGISFDELPVVRRAKKERKQVTKRLEALDRKRRELVPFTSQLDKAVVELIKASKEQNPGSTTIFPERDHSYRYQFSLADAQEPFHVSVSASILDQGTRLVDPDTSDAWRYTISGPYTMGHGAPLHDFKKDGNNNYSVLGFKDGKKYAKLPKPKTIRNYTHFLNGLAQGLQTGATTITSRH